MKVFQRASVPEKAPTDPEELRRAAEDLERERAETEGMHPSTLRQRETVALLRAPWDAQRVVVEQLDRELLELDRAVQSSDAAVAVSAMRRREEVRVARAAENARARELCEAWQKEDHLLRVLEDWPRRERQAAAFREAERGLGLRR